MLQDSNNSPLYTRISSALSSPHEGEGGGKTFASGHSDWSFRSTCHCLAMVHEMNSPSRRQHFYIECLPLDSMALKCRQGRVGPRLGLSLPLFPRACLVQRSPPPDECPLGHLSMSMVDVFQQDSHHIYAPARRVCCAPCHVVSLAGVAPGVL
ncbi:hypothetical protein ZHAS_00016744 [Anopheles sinensis]|uniref:Uncharacterized protein n=1 Tax=Anopheles sinensis TaxID=74873 RepID=A0A084WE66_ANOSI|nr:hypothetical protein ZHAS_00016744 [Anopheles sinensis]